MPTMFEAHFLPVPGKKDLYYCSKCGGIVPHKGKMPVYVINQFCRKCGAKIANK